MKEEWRDIKGYEGIYQVSNFGRVIKLYPSIKIRKAVLHSKGYFRIGLAKNGNAKYYLIHRLVANSFIGLNEEDEVDHINQIKTDNRVSNLRIVTHRENNQNKSNNSKYIGVFLRNNGTFHTRVQIKGKLIYFGTFLTEKDAFDKYNAITNKLKEFEDYGKEYSFEKIKIDKNNYDIKIINL